VTEIYAAREDPVTGVSGKLVSDRLAEVRPGMPVGWAPSLVDAARLAASLARPGGLLLTVGAGDVDSTIPLLQEQLGS
jgi:UDP-N-acetylmuramate--alanine ligase